MIKIEINKAQAVDPRDKSKAAKSVSIIIDKEWTGPEPRGLTQDGYFKAQDKMMNDQAMAMANALSSTLPRGVWDRLVGIMVRMHATYLTISQDDYGKKGDVDEKVSG
jgi:hypothetical protein